MKGRLVGRLSLGSFVAVAALIAAPGGAGAATQVGQTVDPSSSACSQNLTWLQSVSPGNGSFAVPSDGVITSWSFLGGSIVPSQLKLKVGQVGTTSLTIVGESAFETPAANSLNTFSTRVTVHAGDVIGFYFPSPNFAKCAATGQVGYTDAFATGDILPPGGTGSPITSEPGGHLDISALLEPDADHDGFGDETQDQCPSNATTQGPCPATGQRAAALKKCKKKHSAKARKKCRKKAKKLPV